MNWCATAQTGLDDARHYVFPCRDPGSCFFTQYAKILEVGLADNHLSIIGNFVPAILVLLTILTP